MASQGLTIMQCCCAQTNEKLNSGNSLINTEQEKPNGKFRAYRSEHQRSCIFSVSQLRIVMDRGLDRSVIVKNESSLRVGQDLFNKQAIYCVQEGLQRALILSTLQPFDHSPVCKAVR